MEPDKTYMKKAKIELFSNCFAGLSKQNELKNYFKANHSKKFKSSHYRLMDYVRDGDIQGRSSVFSKVHCLCILPSLTLSMKTIIKTQKFSGTLENLH